jgi:rubrerythrin
VIGGRARCLALFDKARSVHPEQQKEILMATWVCSKCGFKVDDRCRPAKCSKCGATKEEFKKEGAEQPQPKKPAAGK